MLLSDKRRQRSRERDSLSLSFAFLTFVVLEFSLSLSPFISLALSFNVYTQYFSFFALLLISSSFHRKEKKRAIQELNFWRLEEKSERAEEKVVRYAPAKIINNMQCDKSVWREREREKRRR
jgi:hypothetical protein